MSLLRQLLFGASLIGALALYLWWSHHRLVSAQAEAAIEKSRADGLVAQLDAAHQDARIVTKYVDRVRTVHERGATIVKKVPVYVPAQTVAACTLNRGFVRVLNAAAADTALPGAATALDAAPAGVGLDTVAASVVDNYTSANTIREQLIALQQWVRAHSAPARATSTGPP